VSVSAAAGHSSVPPDHTSIGYLSHLIVHLESNPHPLHLTRKNPFYSALVCAASYGSLPRPMDALVKGSLTDDNALYQLEGWLRTQKQFKPLIGTSQAVDLTGGGHKVNALPETAWAVINHRIGIDSSTAELKERTVRLISEKARELNLTLTAFGQDVLSSPGVAHVDVEAFGHWSVFTSSSTRSFIQLH
jgi:Gly-Xaa carboxypeptidase